MSRWIILNIIIVTLILSYVESSNWPLAQCSRNDPNLNQCMLEAARKIIPTLKDGNEELGLPPMDPMDGGNYTLSVSRGPVSLDLILNNIKIYGPTKFHVKKMNFNKKTFYLFMEGVNDNITLLADYALVGRLLLFPLNSKGDLKFEFRTMELQHNINFEPITTKEKSYIKMDLDLSFPSYSEFLMRFNSPNMGNWTNARLNWFFNYNSRFLFNSFKEVAWKMVADIFTRAFKPMFDKYSYDDLLPEQV